MRINLLALALGFALLGFAFGCSRECKDGGAARGTTNKAVVPSDDATKKAENYNQAKLLIAEEYNKLDRLMTNDESTKLIATAIRSSDELPKLEKKYAEARSKNSDSAALDAIAKEYGQIAFESDQATRALLNKIRDTLRNVDVWLLAAASVDPELFKSEQEEFEQLDRPSRAVRESLLQAAKAFLPVNELVTKKMNALKKQGKLVNGPGEIALLYEPAAKEFLERKTSAVPESKNP